MKLSEFMQRCEAGPPAVVVGVADGVGLGIVRDLGREGVPVLAAGSNGAAPALPVALLRGADVRDSHYDEDEFIADLMAVGATIPQRAVLLPPATILANAISRHKDRLEEHFWIPMLDWERMRLLADKRQQTELAHRAGVETPITACESGGRESVAAAETVPFPATLQPSAPMAAAPAHRAQGGQRRGPGPARGGLRAAQLLRHAAVAGDGAGARRRPSTSRAPITTPPPSRRPSSRGASCASIPRVSATPEPARAGGGTSWPT